jgi:Tfp pilus assembly protein PilV
MKLPGKRRQSRRGTSFIEVMVAGLLLSIGIMALVQVWAFSYRVTVNTDDKTLSYNLGRRAMEEVKKNFLVARYDPANMLGTTTAYYSGTGEKLTGASGAQYSVTTAVVTDGATPPLYTASVKVNVISTGAVQYSTGTYLVKQGI